MVRALAADMGWGVADIRQSARPADAIRENRWMVTGGNAGLLAELESRATPEPARARRIVWTDDSSALLPVIKWR